MVLQIISNQIGIDAGGTLIKIAYFTDNGSLQLLKYPSKEISAVVEWLKQSFHDAAICVTGGKGELLHKLIKLNLKRIIEFDATCSGVLYLLRGINNIPSSFVLTNVGTGTSVHLVNKDGHHRIGGTGVGGGTMIGLAELLAGVSDFDNLVHLAQQGVRDHLDLKVSQIYEGAESPISGDLTASNFGNPAHSAAEISKSDYLASIIGLVGETVSTVSVLAAGQHGVASIIYIGSSFIDNESLKKVVMDYTLLRGATPLILHNGEYSGAIGALLSLGS